MITHTPPNPLLAPCALCPLLHDAPTPPAGPWHPWCPYTLTPAEPLIPTLLPPSIPPDTPAGPWCLLHPLAAPDVPHPLTPCWPSEPLHPLPAPMDPHTPTTLPAPWLTPWEPLYTKDLLSGRVTIFFICNPQCPLKCSFSIVITLQLTIFTSTSSLQYTIMRCQEYIFSAVKLSQFLQYLPKHAL